MGLSLRNVAKKIGSVLGHAENAVAHGGAVHAIGHVIHAAPGYVEHNVLDPLAQAPVDASAQLYQHIVAPTLHLPNLNQNQVSFNPGVQSVAKKIGATGSRHQTVASAIQLALALGTGGVGNVLEKGTSAVLPDVAPAVAKSIVPKMVSSGGQVGAFNAAAAAGQGATPGEIAKSGATGAAIGSLFPVAGKVIGKTVKAVPKAAVAIKQAPGKFAAYQDSLDITPPAETPKTPAPAKVSVKTPAAPTPTPQVSLRTPKPTTTDLPLVRGTSKNPFKSTARNVKAGDYAGARLAAQQLTYPVKVVAGRFEQAMNDLQKTDPESWSNFWRLAEKPPATASPELTRALYWWREGANRIQAHANSAGKETAYLKNFGLHPWQLNNVTEEQLARGGAGILKQHAISRKYPTIAAGEKAGLKLGDNPTAEGLKYLNGGSAALSRILSKKALTAADSAETTKPHTLDLGWGHTVQLSDKGIKESKALTNYLVSESKIPRGLRTANVGLKSAILSYGQFHPFNISVLRAGPSLALKGHVNEALTGVGRTFRPLLPGGKEYVDKVLTQAYRDGMIDKAAQIGMPYGEAGYNVAGTALKGGAGHRLVFERQMPLMHDQVVRSVIADLEKNGVPLDSEAARQAGIVGNATMGFINKEALNMSPRLRQSMSDWMLAGQFTPSKIVTLSKLTKGGEAGKYARTDVTSNAIAALALVTGIGFVLQQKSDSIRDLVLRALIDPAIPTPFKDAKGNNIEVGIPATYTGDISKLIGLKLVRGPDGHLTPEFHPGNLPKSVADWIRARLSPLASTAVDLKTNTEFGNKPLFDPNAPLGTKAIQATTTEAQGMLPIGAQGLPYTSVVKEHVPDSVKQILDANTPGSNPVIKSGLSSVGFRTRTDTSTGKGLESKRYFDARDWALSQAKNDTEKSALLSWLGSKKNPVTNDYSVKPNPNDTQAKARDLLRSPEAFNTIYSMNQRIAKEGGKVDPLWTQSQDKIKSVLSYQAMPPGGPDKAHWITQNKSWYLSLSDQRSKFFNSLPKGDPNAPQQPIEYPSPSKDVAAKQEKFFNISDSAERAKYLQDNPDIQTQLDKQAEYNNKLREATGYSALDTFPTAPKGLQKIIDQYNALPKHDGPKGGNATRSAWIRSHPQEFANMTKYFTSASLYGLDKEAAQAQFKDTEMSQKGLKDLYNLGQYDVVKNADGTYALGSGGSSSSSPYSKYGGSAGPDYKGVHALLKNNRVSIKRNLGRVKKAHISTPSSSKVKSKGPSKPKVSIKASKV